MEHIQVGVIDETLGKKLFFEIKGILCFWVEWGPEIAEGVPSGLDFLPGDSEGRENELFFGNGSHGLLMR
jgi:hypothetical protein